MINSETWAGLLAKYDISGPISARYPKLPYQDTNIADTVGDLSGMAAPALPTIILNFFGVRKLYD